MTKRSDERANFLANTLSTACEGGISYWASVGDYDWGFPDMGHSDGRPWLAGEQAYVTAKVWEDDSEDVTPFDVDLETIAKGWGLFMDKTWERDYFQTDAKLANRTNGEDGDVDAEVADVVLQLALFGEVVYG
jgi:hypothetical protein